MSETTGTTTAATDESAAAETATGTTEATETAATGTTETTSTETADETVPMSKGEVEALRRQAREGREAIKKAERDAEAAKRKQLEDKGEHQQIAEAEKARADAAEARALKLERDARIATVAGRLKFRHADEAIALIPSDTDLDDEAGLEQALKALSTERPHLIDNGAPARTGAPAGDTTASTGGQKFTRDQIKAMTPQQIAALSPTDFAEMQKTLAGQG